MSINQLLFTIAASFALAGCEFIGNVFEAGVWFGVIAVVVVLALIGFIVSRFRR